MINNLRRDMRWINEPTDLTTPGSSTAWSSSLLMKADNTTYERHGYFQTGKLALAGTAGNWYAFGVFLSWDIEAGSVPFRIKGCVNNDDALWFTAWALTGLERTMADANWIGMGRSIDEAVCVRQNSSYQAHQIGFGCAVPADAGNTVVMGSVQKLLGQPDQYSASVY